MKITSLAITIVICSLFSIVLGVYYADIATNYDISYDGSATEGLDQLEEINDLSGQINQTLGSSQASSTGFNIVGDFLASGYKALQIAVKSLSAFTTMANSAIDKVPGLGATSNTFRVAIMLIVGIIVLGIIISALFNRDM